METSLKAIRLSLDVTQKQAAEILGVSLRTYVSYENDESKHNNRKYTHMVQDLQEKLYIDEDHGILKMNDIKSICQDVLSSYGVRYAFLFGSYAKGKATEKSDVDLLVSAPTSGLMFYSLAEDLRQKLHKRIDLLDVDQLDGNISLTDEILAEGVKIYG